MHITHALGHALRGRRRLTVATLIVAFCATMALGIGGPTVASAAPPQFSDVQDDLFNCPVHTYAEGRIKRVYLPNGTYERRLQVTTNTHIGPNGFIFVGCRAGIYVDVVAKNGDILETLEHEALAGSVFDPFGNNKDYSWVDFPEMSDATLDQIDHLDIRQTHRD